MNTSKKPQRRWFSLLLAGTVVATVCTGGVKAKGPFTPTFEIVACPERVTAEEASTVSCAYLTVLQNRTVSNGRTIRLFVTRAEPVEGNPPPDPMFGAGPLSAERDLGWSHPERVVGSRAGRVLFSMDVRGTGYSEPNLSCPEIEQLTDPSTGITLGTREMETAFLSAVQACHNRLTAEGIDLASYDLEAMAGDAEDLRTALGIDDWNLISWGTTSPISFEIMRRYPQHIRSVAMDSPMAPQLDQFTQAVVGTEWAFGQVVQACKARPACREAFPHLHAAWREALRGLDDHPSEILDEDLEIVVDDATAVRQLRNNLAVGGHTSCFLSCGLDTFPLAVYDLREHGWANGGPAGRLVEWSGAPPFHVGYDIQWWPSVFVPEAELSECVTYSHLCHDEVPFIDQAALVDAAGGRPWYVEAYVESPYSEICERWNVGQAATAPHKPLVTGIPVMMFIGTMDPFSPLPPLKDAATDLSNGSIVKVPVGRNVLENECMIGIRDAFVDHPMSPLETICVADLERIRFVPPPPPTRSPKPGEAVITTVVGDGAIGSSGDGKLATQAQLSPEDVVVDAAGALYVDDGVGRVRKVDLSGRISTVVGPPTGVAPPAPGQASTVEMNAPTALAIDGDGNLYVGGGNGTSRMIIRVDPSSGEVTTIAGTGERGFSGDGGPATEATMTWCGTSPSMTRGTSTSPTSTTNVSAWSIPPGSSRRSPGPARRASVAIAGRQRRRSSTSLAGSTWIRRGGSISPTPATTGCAGSTAKGRSPRWQGMAGAGTQVTVGRRRRRPSGNRFGCSWTPTTTSISRATTAAASAWSIRTASSQRSRAPVSRGSRATAARQRGLDSTGASAAWPSAQTERCTSPMPRTFASARWSSHEISITTNDRRGRR